MKQPMAMVATPGEMMGSTILWKMVISLAPSIRGASSTALGRTDMRYCRRKNTVPELAMAGTIRGM